MNEQLQLLDALGFTLPGPAYIAGAIVFSIVGYGAWRYGKKQSNAKLRWLGLALMLYPYLIAETWLLYAVGGGLCIALYLLRK